MYERIIQSEIIRANQPHLIAIFAGMRVEEGIGLTHVDSISGHSKNDVKSAGRLPSETSGVLAPP